MQRIFKYEIARKENRYQTLQLPVGAVFRHAEGLGTRMHVWYQVDDQEPVETRTFYVAGTGSQIPEDLGTFLGTVTCMAGQFRGHIYEAPNQKG